MKQSLLKILALTASIINISIFSSSLAWSANVDSILAEQKAPAGVVFEIVSGQADLLNKLLPTLKTDIMRLRKRFPNIAIAIVSHGSEQFALTTENKKQATLAHSLVEELVNKNKVDVHVCETHAGWYGITAEDFPSYVDVTPAGPTQINDYVELGYDLIVLP